MINHIILLKNKKILIFETSDLDLHLTYGKTTLNIYEKEPNSNIYSVKITDRYNFEYWDPNEPLTKNNELYKFIVYMNDAAYFLQFFGVINNYDYSIQFDYKYDKGE